MRTKTLLPLALALSLEPSALLFAAWLGPAFTYQGQLDDAGLPANGLYDLRLTLFDAVTSGSPVSGVLTNAATPVSNGLFTVTLDFGSSPFNIGQSRWLQIEVRTNGAPSFSALTPRQALTATPYALYAPNAGTAALSDRARGGSITSAALAPGAVTTSAIAPGAITAALLPANVAYLDASSQTFTGQNAFDTLVADTVTATSYNGSGSGLSDLWKLGGNAGTTPGTHFLGTTDPQPVEVRANNSRALQLIPQTNGVVQIIAGYRSNEITGAQSAGSVIAGGGREPEIRYNPRDNIWTTNYRHQVVSAAFSFIGGGIANTNQSDYSVVAGGYANRIDTNVPNSVIAGGGLNQILSQSNFIQYGNTIGGGGYNKIEDATQSTIAGGVSGGIGPASLNATIGGGNYNKIQSWTTYCTIAGGNGNTIQTNAANASIGGGVGNSVGTNTQNATIPGGYYNQAGGKASFAAGCRAQALHDGSFVWGDSLGSERMVRRLHQRQLLDGAGQRRLPLLCQHQRDRRGVSASGRQCLEPDERS